jgi:uncharacterized protein (TIGR02246 family)
VSAPATRGEFEKYAEAVKNNDAAAVAALFTEDAVFVTSNAGAVYGREAIEELFAEWFKGSHCNDHISMRYPNSVRILTRLRRFGD